MAGPGTDVCPCSGAPWSSPSMLFKSASLWCLPSSFFCSMGLKSSLFSNLCVIREIFLFYSASRGINALAQEHGAAQETQGLVVTPVLLLQSLPQGPWLARKGSFGSQLLLTIGTTVWHSSSISFGSWHVAALSLPALVLPGN